MTIKATLKAFTLAATLALALNTTAVLAQEKDAPQTSTPQEEQLQEQQEQKPSQTDDEKLVQDGPKAAPSDIPAEAQANRRGQLSEEEAAILPYYNNFLSNYYLGPEDVISVTVFGQDRYSRPSIVVPPNGRISYPLIREGIFVGGKTVEQVQDELTKRLDEYIIDPKVTVALEKAVSARYSVLGDVGQPGIKTMSRRLSVYEALAEAGGVLDTGDKKKVVILRRQADGNVHAIPVNVRAIEQGKAKEMAYLVPGDQVIVPGNKWKTFDKLFKLVPILNFARVFGLPF